jgi:50S ribosomal subunit-associated GTPase HflX
MSKGYSEVSPLEMQVEMEKLNVEHERLREKHRECRTSEDDGSCAGHGELWANALNYVNLASRKIDREIVEYNNRLREMDTEYESDGDC